MHPRRPRAAAGAAARAAAASAEATVRVKSKRAATPLRPPSSGPRRRRPATTCPERIQDRAALPALRATTIKSQTNGRPGYSPCCAKGSYKDQTPAAPGPERGVKVVDSGSKRNSYAGLTMRVIETGYWPVHPIYETMLVVDTPGPVPGQLAFKWLWFSNSCERVTRVSGALARFRDLWVLRLPQRLTCRSAATSVCSSGCVYWPRRARRVRRGRVEATGPCGRAPSGAGPRWSGGRYPDRQRQTTWRRGRVKQTRSVQPRAHQESTEPGSAPSWHLRT
jgi:hypothetical protein